MSRPMFCLHYGVASERADGSLRCDACHHALALQCIHALVERLQHATMAVEIAHACERFHDDGDIAALYEALT